MRKNRYYIDEICSFAVNDLEVTILENLGFEIPESESNFLFAAPPDRNGQKAFEFLREAEIIVRFFNKEVTKDYIRITIGTPEENNRLVEVLAKHYPAK
jgi:histidinol-phosphate aminotransferase